MMTPQEHSLMLMLYAKQNLKFNVPFEALKASGVLQPDDLEAYHRYAFEETPEQLAEWIHKAWRVYQSTAATLGVATGLDDGPIPGKKTG